MLLCRGREAEEAKKKKNHCWKSELEVYWESRKQKRVTHTLVSEKGIGVAATRPVLGGKKNTANSSGEMNRCQMEQLAEPLKLNGTPNQRQRVLFSVLLSPNNK